MVPVELHGLDVKSQSRADCGDVFIVQAFHNSSLASIVQAPAVDSVCSWVDATSR